MNNLLCRKSLGAVSATSLVAFLILGCQSTTAVQMPIGQLKLVSYNGAALPAFLAKLPDPGLDGISNNCNLLVSSGGLAIREGRYRMWWQQTNSCSGLGLGGSVDSGTVTLHGDSLSFTLPGVRPPIWGQVLGNEVTVLYSDLTLKFTH